MNVKDANGAVTTWNFELGSLYSLTKHGWTKTTIKMGDQVSVDAWLAKDGSKMASAKSVTLAKGKEMWGASSFFEGAVSQSN